MDTKVTTEFALYLKMISQEYTNITLDIHLGTVPQIDRSSTTVVSLYESMGASITLGQRSLCGTGPWYSLTLHRS